MVNNFKMLQHFKIINHIIQKSSYDVQFLNVVFINCPGEPETMLTAALIEGVGAAGAQDVANIQKGNQEA